VSRLKTEFRSSRAVNEKNRFVSANAVMPMVRASFSPSLCSAPAMTASVAAAMTTPAMQNQRVSVLLRIGFSGLRGRRPMRPELGSP
jgi:hypothetical protein